MKEFDISQIKIRMQAGGKVVPTTKLLAGQTIKEAPKGVIPNVEAEDGEFVKFPGDGETLKIEGKKHSQGGVDMAVPDQTRFLTDKGKPNTEQRKMINNTYDLAITAKHTFSDVMDRYLKKLGITKIEKEQEELFKLLEKDMNNTKSEATRNVNQEYISKKLVSAEKQIAPLNKLKEDMFDKLYNMQETNKGNKNPEGEFMYGGIKRSEFLAQCEKQGLTPQEGFEALVMREKILQKRKMDGGGIIADPKELTTGSNLTPAQKKNLIIYYNNYNKPLAEALTTGQLKWEDQAFNKGLIEELSRTPPTPINTGKQPRDKTGRVISETYGAVSQSMIDNFLLKDYYEYKNPGKSFADITEQDIRSLQEEYGTGLQKITGLNYYSGDETKSEKSDGLFGNRTASYVGVIADAKAKKEATINLNAYRKAPKEERQKIADEYGVSLEDLTKYAENPAYQYLRLAATEPTPEPEDKSATPPADERTEDTGKPVVDNVLYTPRRKVGPVLFNTPDQTPLPPSPMEAHLKTDVNLRYLESAKVKANTQELINTRNFLASQVENLPESQRAAVLASMNASTGENINKAEIAATNINAANQSQTDVFNIRQDAAEQASDQQSLLNYEYRQLTAKANAEEGLRGFFDQLNKINVTNFKNQQRLNLLNGLFPDFDLSPTGMDIAYNPSNPDKEFSTQERLNMMNQFLGPG